MIKHIHLERQLRHRCDRGVWTRCLVELSSLKINKQMMMMIIINWSFSLLTRRVSTWKRVFFIWDFGRLIIGLIGSPLINEFSTTTIDWSSGWTNTTDLADFALFVEDFFRGEVFVGEMDVYDTGSCLFSTTTGSGDDFRDKNERKLRLRSVSTKISRLNLQGVTKWRDTFGWWWLFFYFRRRRWPTFCGFNTRMTRSRRRSRRTWCSNFRLRSTKVRCITFSCFLTFRRWYLMRWTRWSRWIGWNCRFRWWWSRCM